MFLDAGPGFGPRAEATKAASAGGLESQSEHWV